MRNAIKLGMYAAAGIGVYTILKRYGILDDVGRWLSDQVPEDYKRQAAHRTKQLRQRLGDATEYVRDHAGQIRDDMKERASDMKGRADDAIKAGGKAAKQFVGKVEETISSDGSSASHNVGRGVRH